MQIGIGLTLEKLRGMTAAAAVSGLVLAGAFALAATSPANAQDGGPDYFQVSGVPGGDTLNIRSGPGTGNRVVAVAPNGAKFRNLGCSNGWCHVETADGRVNGWAASQFLVEAGGAPNHHTSSGDNSVPELHVRNTGEIEVRFAAGCTVLYNSGGGRLTAGSSCSRAQLTHADDAVQRHLREQGPGTAGVEGGGGQTEVSMDGSGSIIGGSATQGRIFGHAEGRYAVMITSVDAGLTCTGTLQHAPGVVRSEVTSVHCSNGVNGTATLLRSRSGTKHTLNFILTDGTGGFVIF